jgi:phage-related minor tail protein
MPTEDIASAADAAAGLTRQMESLATVSGAFGKAITGAFANGIIQGKKFEDTLRGVGEKLVSIGLKAGLQPLQQGVSSALSSALTAATSGLSRWASGNLGLSGMGNVPVTPFADGGVLAAPAYFPAGRGLGLAGEAGPEAILPLSRGPDGRLGVKAGAGGGATTVNVTISTPDAGSFHRSEAQVSAMLARAVARGQRAL